MLEIILFTFPTIGAESNEETLLLFTGVRLQIVIFGKGMGQFVTNVVFVKIGCLEKERNKTNVPFDTKMKPAPMSRIHRHLNGRFLQLYKS